jgi:hypothetical protein
MEEVLVWFRVTGWFTSSSRDLVFKARDVVQKFLNLKDLGFLGPLSPARGRGKWLERAKESALII